jgi:hypothetical protein
MSHPIIQPPFTLEFREMPKSELRKYCTWFMDVMPGRIKVLEDAVRETSGFEAWRADFTPDSLDSLGEWFAGQVATRERTAEELAKTRAEMTMDFPVESRELTNRTYSLAVDIGMYLGEVMRKTHANLRWSQDLKNKRYADYGQITINGTDVVPMNTIRLMVVLARCFVDKSRPGRRLRELYNIWSGPESGLFVPPPAKKSKKTA